MTWVVPSVHLTELHSTTAAFVTTRRKYGRVKQLFQAIRLRDGVIVHAPNPIRPIVARSADAGVEAARTAKVRLRNHGEVSLSGQPLRASVGTSIVYDNDFANLIRLVMDRLNAFL